MVIVYAQDQAFPAFLIYKALEPGSTMSFTEGFVRSQGIIRGLNVPSLRKVFNLISRKSGSSEPPTNGKSGKRNIEHHNNNFFLLDAEQAGSAHSGRMRNFGTRHMQAPPLSR